MNINIVGKNVNQTLLQLNRISLLFHQPSCHLQLLAQVQRHGAWNNKDKIIISLVAKKWVVICDEIK